MEFKRREMIFSPEAIRKDQFEPWRTQERRWYFQEQAKHIVGAATVLDRGSYRRKGEDVPMTESKKLRVESELAKLMEIRISLLDYLIGDL